MIFFYICHIRSTEAAVSECSETAIAIKVWEFSVQISEFEEEWKEEETKEEHKNSSLKAEIQDCQWNVCSSQSDVLNMLNNSCVNET